MITGIVNDNHEIIIRLTVRGPSGQEREIDAILDTGFDRSLTLTPKVIGELGLPLDSPEEAILANGAVEEFDTYSAIVFGDETPRSIAVHSIDAQSLAGMDLLIGYDLQARIRPGGHVEIKAIS